MADRGNTMARRTHLEIKISGVDITQDIAPFLISFSYEDNRSGEADSVSVTLEDSDGRFRGDWFPKRNTALEASIVTEDWDGTAGATFRCGSFEIDELEASQGEFSIRGISSPVTAAGRRERITRTWEKTDLRTVAADIAAKAGLPLKYTADENPKYCRIDQKQQSSLEFLFHIVTKAGLAIKVVDGSIAIYNELDAEKEDASFTVERTGGQVLGWSFRTQSVDTYKSCDVAYFDSKSKQTYRGSAKAEGESYPSGQVLKIANERVESDAEAITLAEKALRESNKREVTGRLDCVGDTRLMAGVVVAVSGFGSFDGKYRIAKSTHTIDSGGYRTSVDLESGPPKVREGGRGERKAGKKKKKREEWRAYFE